ncbi:hypothetical protein MHH33_11225 [Paenisporosarcina sp. FSL H8-0542]|uniref:hypothetical protein n=1 Tax=Paenisporosarcina sp. FSL H8-0542 TaxID=2921401 RepID=UPI00034EA182|nr:hypothetical protein HMPREF1210_01042 [Paenisporosarcina sp. HGH0030]
MRLHCLWLYLNKSYGTTLDDFAKEKKIKAKQKYDQDKFRFKMKSEEYFSPLRIHKMQNT